MKLEKNNVLLTDISLDKRQMSAKTDAGLDGDEDNPTKNVGPNLRIRRKANYLVVQTTNICLF